MSQISTGTRGATRPTTLPDAVDNTDWLKTAAIIFVFVDHFGFFFMDDDRWSSVFGRFAAPPFFFLVGYAQSRTVPLHWIWIGVILTLLESWNANWTWVAPNILLSLALIRVARPYVLIALQRYSWTAFVLLVLALVAAQPVAGKILDYGAEGWLWALVGLCQRLHGDSAFADDRSLQLQNSSAPVATAPPGIGLMRIVACLVASVFFVWQEQKEFSFPAIHLAVFIVGLCILSTSLCLFRRGKSRIQPPQKIAAMLRFIGRHTLEIYAIQLAGSELLVKLVPDLAP